MANYHLNPSTGEPGLCGAQRDKCPFGSREEHFSSPEAARKSFEESQKSGLAKLGKGAPLLLHDVLDIELLNKMLKERFIYESIHPDDNSYVLYCYTVSTQIQGKWNDATKLARGLIVQRGAADLSDAQIIARPWSKFFTLAQQQGGWHLGDEENASSAEDAFATLDFDAPASVYDKMDGSLGILYRDPKGLPALATKGSFASPQALDYTNHLRNDEKAFEAASTLISRNDDTTALFELVGPGNRIVLAYDKKEVVLLGGSHKRTGASVDPEELKAWSSADLPVVERMKASTLREALAIEPRDGREGVVVSVGGDTPMKIKIKQDDYLRIHRIVTMFSKKESRGVVMDLDSTTTYADLLAVAESRDVSYFPTIKSVLEVDGFSKGDEEFEFIREKRESYFRDILLPRAEEVKRAKEIVDNLDESYFTGDKPQKRFAAVVKDFGVDQSTLFALYRGRLEGKDVKDISAFHEVRRAVQNVKDSSD